MFSSVKKAEFSKLESGEAHTIGIPDARKRLKGELKVDCTKELALFEKLISHRNKIVHFCHPELDSVETRSQVAIEMLQAWAGLLALKKKQKFNALFEEIEQDFRGIEQEFLRLDAYLDAQEKRIHEERGGSSQFEERSFCRRQTFHYASSTCELYNIQEATHADIMDGNFAPPWADQVNASNAVV